MNLANKYRPSTFKDIVEQSNTKSILMKEIAENNIKPAYMFVGHTGVSKTTTSRVFANSINSNIIELDAASNNSAEKVRDLLESVKQRPIANDYTVVIVDEPQNFSKQAWDSMLLTIESPPPFLIFIFCTTDLDKIPQTIYNRCEVFEFLPISIDGIIGRLKYICEQEGFKYESPALDIIAKLANGSMRQAITYLEQCSTKDITIETVKDTLLADSYDTYMNLVYSICDKDYEAVSKIISKISNQDKFVSEFFTFILSANVYMFTKDMNLTTIPHVYKEDFDNFNDNDINTVIALRKKLLTLQYEGRNNPILKELLQATLFDIME